MSNKKASMVLLRNGERMIGEYDEEDFKVISNIARTEEWMECPETLIRCSDISAIYIREVEDE